MQEELRSVKLGSVPRVPVVAPVTLLLQVDGVGVGKGINVQRVGKEAQVKDGFHRRRDLINDLIREICRSREKSDRRARSRKHDRLSTALKFKVNGGDEGKSAATDGEASFQHGASEVSKGDMTTESLRIERHC